MKNRRDAVVRSARRAATLAVLLAVLVGCDWQREADAKFGDQHFKTAIALVELHKIRTGAYPESLDDLQFVGDWDRIALGSVAYRRLDDGYELDVVRGWIDEPSIAYPPEFWKGLGLRKSKFKPAS